MNIMQYIIIVLCIVGGAVIAGGIFILFMWLFNDKNIVEYPITYIEECNGDCSNCNEEIKEVCKEVEP